MVQSCLDKQYKQVNHQRLNILQDSMYVVILQKKDKTINKARYYIKGHIGQTVGQKT